MLYPKIDHFSPFPLLHYPWVPLPWPTLLYQAFVPASYLDPRSILHLVIRLILWKDPSGCFTPLWEIPHLAQNTNSLPCLQAQGAPLITHLESPTLPPQGPQPNMQLRPLCSHCLLHCLILSPLENILVHGISQKFFFKIIYLECRHLESVFKFTMCP